MAWGRYVGLNQKQSSRSALLLDIFGWHALGLCLELLVYFHRGDVKTAWDLVRGYVCSRLAEVELALASKCLLRIRTRD